MPERRKPEESPEHIMKQTERIQRALDYTWMYAVARCEALEKQKKLLKQELAKEVAGSTAASDIKESLREIDEQLRGLRTEMRSMRRSGVFNSDDEGYTVAREAIAWMETLAGEWSKGGATPEGHLLAEHKAGDRSEPLINDEGLLRQMEDSGMNRIEAAFRGTIPSHLRRRLAVALRAYAKVGDHQRLIRRANELAEQIEGE